MNRLEGKVAIVTGGANGIGRAFSLGLAKEGAHVVVADVADAAAEELAAELRETGPEALAVHVDVGDEASTQAMAEAAREAFGRIDILVTCAAIYANLQRKPFLEIDGAEWDLVLRINLTGVQLSAKAVLPTMQEQHSGAIVNMGSVNTHLVPAGRAHYNAGKAALENLTRSLAREFGPAGIRVNSLAPGLVRTGRAAVTDARYKRTAHDRALQRMKFLAFFDHEVDFADFASEVFLVFQESLDASDPKPFDQHLGGAVGEFENLDDLDGRSDAIQVLRTGMIDTGRLLRSEEDDLIGLEARFERQERFVAHDEKRRHAVGENDHLLQGDDREGRRFGHSEIPR